MSQLGQGLHPHVIELFDAAKVGTKVTVVTQKLAGAGARVEQERRPRDQRDG